jgi:hypothetical protein
MPFIHSKTAGGRESIDATGDDADFSALEGSMFMDDPVTGKMRPMTVEEIKARGVRQIVATKNILTGEWEPR